MAVGTAHAGDVQINTVSSADGTAISYRTFGRGHALLVIPGSLTEARDLDGLARDLGHHFTVHTMDRRGLGDSGPRGDRYGIAAECADVAAVRARTGADLLVGHSFGGFVALEHARTDPSVRALAVYEPGVSIDGSVSMAWAPGCTAYLSQGRNLDAFAHFARGVNPRASGRVPHRLFKVILTLAMRRPEREQKCRLLPGAILEHAEAARLDGAQERYRTVAAPVLVLVGERSTRRTAAGTVATALAGVLPAARVSVLPGMDHFGPEKHPARVAAEIAAHIRAATAPAA